MKKLFLSLIAIAFAICANAQDNDYTVVWEENFNSYEPTTKNAVSYSYKYKGWSTTDFSFGPSLIRDWIGYYDSYTGGIPDGVVSGIFAYGSNRYMEGPSKISRVPEYGMPDPEEDESEENSKIEGNAFGIYAELSKIQYTKDIELEPGVYRFNAFYYNTVDGKTCENLTGVTVYGANYFISNNAFKEKGWHSSSTGTFALLEKTTVTISLGCTASDIKALFFDKIVVEKYNPSSDEDDWYCTWLFQQAALNKLNTLPVIYYEDFTPLFVCNGEQIDAAYEAIEQATTVDEVIDIMSKISPKLPRTDAKYSFVIESEENFNYLSIDDSQCDEWGYPVPVYLGDETYFTLEPTEGGYYLKSGKFYVGLDYNGNKLTMSSDPDKKTVITITLIYDKDWGMYSYTLGTKNGLIGTDKTDWGTACYVDGKEKNNYRWMINEYARDLPVPVSQPLNLEGEEQYFYNLEYGGFFTGANDWGTRASVSREKGMAVPVTAVEGGTYKIGAVSPDDELGVWVDGSRDGNDKFSFVALGDNKFQITCAKFPGKYLTWGGDETNTRVNFTEEKTNGTWISVSKEEYENFLPQLPQVTLYMKAKQLDALIQIAKANDFDVYDEEYAYIFGELTDIEKAIVSIQDKLTPSVPVLASLKDYVDNGTVIVLNKGDEYIYGSTDQNIALGDAAKAIASTNKVNGYIIEHIEKGDIYMLRSVNGGNNVNIFGQAVTYLNAQPSATGVTFNLGKDQDGKDGSSWYIKEVEGGYTIQNVGNGAYLNGANLSADPVVWGISTFDSVNTTVGVSTVSVDAAKSGKFIENGNIVIVKNGQKYNVMGQKQK